MIIDVVVFVGALLFGLIFMWRGVGRTLLSTPVRLISASILAWLISSLAVIYFVVYQPPLLTAMMSRIGLPSPIVLGYVGWILFFILLVALLIVLSRIKAHVLKEKSDNSVGTITRAARFVFGAAAGLLLVLVFAVPTFMSYEAFVTDPNELASQLSGSISLPLIKRISDATRPLLERSLPPSLSSAPNEGGTEPAH
jgi:uncharacterized membrane protein required for colicin V production